MRNPHLVPATFQFFLFSTHVFHSAKNSTNVLKTGTGLVCLRCRVLYGYRPSLPTAFEFRAAGLESGLVPATVT